MKLFLIDGLMQPGKFAQFAHVGTWLDGDICPECGVTSEKLVPPLQIEWEPGTENIGDFAWCYWEFVVNKKVRDFMEASGFRCSFSKTEVVAPATRSRVPRVALPYVGPRLYWVRPKVRITLVESLSGVTLRSVCSKCGAKRYKREGNRIVVTKEQVGTNNIFRLKPGSSPVTYLTETGARELEEQQFSGYKLMEAGEVVD